MSSGAAQKREEEGVGRMAGWGDEHQEAFCWEHSACELPVASLTQGGVGQTLGFVLQGPQL